MPAEPATYQQRKRTKGWKAPPNSVCCTRPGRWGNPFRVVQCSERCVKYFVGTGSPDTGSQLTDCMPKEDAAREAIRLYRRTLDRAVVRRELAGKVLLCWCKPGEPCHVQDVLIPIANGAK